MRIPDEQREEENAVNLMPLIDMVFLLLIFFLVATTFAQEEREIPIDLPGTSMAQPLSAPPPQLILNVRKDGSVKVGTKVFDVRQRRQLGELVEQVVRRQPEKEVLVRADRRGIHQHFARVVELCKRSVDEVKIGYIGTLPMED